MQGSGTFGVEAVLSSVVPKDPSKGALLIIANGAYGTRMGEMAKVHKLNYTLLETAENTPPDLAAIDRVLKEAAKPYTHVAVVHSETTSGILNDVETIGKLVHKHGKCFIVDAMSSFGAVPIDLEK
jgi:2-aminoethylphosphonate-pyruvate transaminase